MATATVFTVLHPSGRRERFRFRLRKKVLTPQRGAIDRTCRDSALSRRTLATLPSSGKHRAPLGDSALVIRDKTWYHDKIAIRRSEMSARKLTGSFVALITPFNKDGSVDFEAFRSLLKFQADNGTSAILIMGSTGETSTLFAGGEEEDHRRDRRDEDGGRCRSSSAAPATTPSRPSPTSGSPRTTAPTAPSSPRRPTSAREADIEGFFLDIADATDLPLGIYNNPPRVKSDLHWDHLLRIFKRPNYVVRRIRPRASARWRRCWPASRTSR